MAAKIGKKTMDKLDKDKFDKVLITKETDEKGKKKFVFSSEDGQPIRFKEAMVKLLSSGKI